MGISTTTPQRAVILCFVHHWLGLSRYFVVKLTPKIQVLQPKDLPVASIGRELLADEEDLERRKGDVCKTSVA